MIRTGFVIENKRNPSSWLSTETNKLCQWTNDTSEAILFCREKDAECFVKLFGITDIIIQEQIWYN